MDDSRRVFPTNGERCVTHCNVNRAFTAMLFCIGTCEKHAEHFLAAAKSSWLHFWWRTAQIHKLHIVLVGSA